MRQPRSPSRFAVLVIGLTLVVAACGSSASATPSPTPPPTPTPTARPTVRPTATPSPTATPGASLALTGRIEVVADGYALTLPDGWFRAALSDEELAAMYELGADALPAGITDLMEDQISQAVLSGMSLMAFREMTAEVPLGTTMNVIAAPSLGLSLDVMEGLGSAQLSAMIGIDVEIETDRVTLPAGDALVLTYIMPFDGPPAVEIAARQFMLIGTTKQYIISCTTPGSSSAIRAECDAIAESFEFLP